MERGAVQRGRAGVTVVVLALLAAGAAPPAPSSAFASVYEAANALYKSGSFELALGAYEKAYGIEPRPEALYGKARCLDQLRRGGDAIAAYERFLVLAPAHEGAPKAKGYLVAALHADAQGKLARRDWAGARAALDRALALHPALPPDATDVTRGVLLAALGEALDGLGESAAAAAALREALSAPLPADVRARALAVLERVAPPPESVAAPESGAAAVSGGALSPTGPAARPKSRAPLALGLACAGVALVAGGVALGVWVATRPTHLFPYVLEPR